MLSTIESRLNEIAKDMETLKHKLGGEA